jgi:DNA helicase HerA-like ATPase
VLHDGTCAPEPLVGIPLAMVTRHGLIAGATGTGKTKTLQLLAEQCAVAGVPVFLADVKGDLSGLAASGEASERTRQRAQDTGYDWTPRAAPVEFLSLTGANGAQLRATVSSFGPLLLAKVLDLNATQTSVLTLVFKYCDDQGLLLLDFADLRSVLQHLATDEGASELKAYGASSKTTLGVLLREMVELETQGAGRFFGEPEFDLDDLLVVEPGGQGRVSVLDLTDVQDKPALFSTFMLWMLARLYATLPEVGDADRPKLVFFFDEAHLLFDDATEAFRDQVEQVVRLIRSKGVGVYFITQSPKDVPADVLGQLGNRVQHALRAFTPDDAKALRAAARTFPKTAFYDVEETLTTLGIGEALVTVLAPSGAPTPPFAVRLVPPASRMGPLTAAERQARLATSAQVQRYRASVDRDSARERLEQRAMRTADAAEAAAEAAARAQAAPAARQPARAAGDAPAPRRGRPPKSALEQVLGSSTTRSVVNTVARTLLGALLGGTRRR